MKRKFPYILVGQILDELKAEGLSLTRVTFLRLEKRLNLPEPRRTSSQTRWRVYTREEADYVKDRIKTEYNII